MTPRKWGFLLVFSQANNGAAREAWFYRYGPLAVSIAKTEHGTGRFAAHIETA